MEINTIFIGQSLIHLKEVDSTNIAAQNILSESQPPEGTVITTSYQVSGRGQIGNSWYSSKEKNIMCSTILYPKWLLAKEQFHLNIAISCAVRSLVQKLIPTANVRIKWPNDIYIDDKKTAGILIQNTLSGSGISSSIVGIGINVNETEFPSELPNPTSILLSSSVVRDLDNVYAELYAEIERYYLKLRHDQIYTIKEEYVQHLYGKDRPLNFILTDGRIVTGIIQDVIDSGKLAILINGEEKLFAFRELRFQHSV